MGVFGNAGANLHDNAKGLNIGDIVAQAGRNAFGTVAGAVAPTASIAGGVGGAMQDFFHGLATGHAIAQAAAPQTTAKAQAKAPTGGVKAPNYTQAFLDAAPNFVQQAAMAAKPAAPAAAAAPATPARATNPFDEAVARYAQANGGISLNELSALSRSAAETSPLRTLPKDPTKKDEVMGHLLDLSDQQYTMAMAQAQAAKKSGDIGGAKALQDSAVKQRQAALQAIIGTNPVDMQTAAAMGTGGAE